MYNFKDLYNIQNGWNGYDAIKPSKQSIDYASEFYKKVQSINIEPTHIGPSVIGGIGFTFESDIYEYVLEITNDNKVIETIIKSELDDFFSLEIMNIDQKFSFDLITKTLNDILSIQK